MKFFAHKLYILVLVVYPIPQSRKDVFKRNNAFSHYDGYGHSLSQNLRGHEIDNFGRHFLLGYIV